MGGCNRLKDLAMSNNSTAFLRQLAVNMLTAPDNQVEHLAQQLAEAVKEIPGQIHLGNQNIKHQSKKELRMHFRKIIRQKFSHKFPTHN